MPNLDRSFGKPEMNTTICIRKLRIRSKIVTAPIPVPEITPAVYGKKKRFYDKISTVIIILLTNSDDVNKSES